MEFFTVFTVLQKVHIQVENVARKVSHITINDIHMTKWNKAGYAYRKKVFDKSNLIRLTKNCWVYYSPNGVVYEMFQTDLVIF